MKGICVSYEEAIKGRRGRAWWCDVEERKRIRNRRIYVEQLVEIVIEMIFEVLRSVESKICYASGVLFMLCNASHVVVCWRAVVSGGCMSVVVNEQIDAFVCPASDLFAVVIANCFGVIIISSSVTVAMLTVEA